MTVDDNSTETFHPTIDELEALKRLEIQTIPVDAALREYIPHRLYDLGYITKNGDGHLTLTAKGLALTRRQ